MKRFITMLTLLLMVIGGTAVVNAPQAQAAVTAPWQYQLNWPVDTTVNAPVFDIDWNAADTGTTAQLKNVVTTLHAKGSKVVCYVDTGGWEDYRSDAGKYPAVVKGNTVDGWPDERFVDVRRWDILGPILTARFQQCKTLGFDAVETDLDDQYPANTGFPLTKMDYVNFDIKMANVIHGLGMQWFLKNGITGDNFISLVEPYADGTINEQCWQYGECSALAPFKNSGKPIYNVEYAGTQASVCPKATAYPTRTIRKPLSLTKNYTWVCNSAVAKKTTLVNGANLVADKTPGFNRDFPTLQAFVPPLEALVDLGDVDGIMFDPNADADDNPDKDPSVFTYYGQFIDHDVTLDNTKSPTAPVDITTLVNGRTPFLDLDSMYGGGVTGNPELYDSKGKFLLAANGRDFVRDSNNAAKIIEGRNDENMVVAQIQVAFMRFHNALIDQGYTFDKAREAVKFHHQWLVLKDFLPRFVDPAILQAAIDDKNPNPNDVDLPVEFSVAAYRFGHSMVRRAYFMADKTTKIQVFREDGNDLRGGRVIPANRIIDWTNFAQIPGGPAPTNISRKIDTLLSSGLFVLPPGAIPTGGPVELAARNMIRGEFYGLPSGQEVAAQLGVTPLTNASLGLTDPRFEGKAPLWFYILGEAEVLNNGARLGPVGSTIIARQFVGMMKNSKEKGILHPSNKKWEPVTGPSFRIGDLFKIAGVA